MNTTDCDSWEEFCAAVRPRDRAPLDAIYRGHARCEWGLVAPSGRTAEMLRLRRAGQKVMGGPAERGQVAYFRRLATGLPGVDVTTLDEDNLEALARHHGLCTNLLDWTLSPYVAAFFAFTEALDLANDGRLNSGQLAKMPIYPVEDPVCIWRLGWQKDMGKKREFERFSGLAQINYWQKAQSGLFTRLTHPEYVNIAEYLAARGLQDRLHKFTIPGSETGKVLHDLETMNITFATLFPDLTGAAKQANVGSTWRRLSLP